MASAGDVNGDGYSDTLIGAHGSANAQNYMSAGGAYLILGPVTGTVNLSSADAKFEAETAGEFAGYSVSGAGDVNGDGYDDIIVGSRYNTEGGNNAGAAFVIHGPMSGIFGRPGADAKYIGEVAGDQAGFSVSGGGDVNGDGYDDLIIGANNEGEGGWHAGAAYVILGAP